MLNETCTMRSTSQVIKADRERRKRNKKQADIFMLMREYICFFVGSRFTLRYSHPETALFCFDDLEAVAHFAALPSIIDAEQYFSADICTARSIALSCKSRPYTLKWIWISVNTRGAVSARLAVTSARQSVIFLALFLGNHHHIDAGTACYTQQQHFHRAGAAFDFAFSRRAFHHNAVSVCRCTDEAHSVYPF